MKHMVIPDTQCKPENGYEHLEWAGKYAAEKKPDVIIHLGDHWDMPSLSSYDKGKGSMEGRRYVEDIRAGNYAMDVFMAPIYEEQKRMRKTKKKVWKPRLVFLMGNHEQRIERAVDDNIQLADLLSYDDFNLVDHGWEVHPFLEVVTINDIAYSHYFTSGVMGRPVSSARLMLNKKHMSCVMGHVQDRDIAWARNAVGVQHTGLFAGIFYTHDEGYLNPQTNTSWRGIWMFHEVKDGGFDEMPVSLNYLEKRYG